MNNVKNNTQSNQDETQLKTSLEQLAVSFYSFSI